MGMAKDNLQLALSLTMVQYGFMSKCHSGKRTTLMFFMFTATTKVEEYSIIKTFTIKVTIGSGLIIAGLTLVHLEITRLATAECGADHTAGLAPCTSLGELTRKVPKHSEKLGMMVGTRDLGGILGMAPLTRN